MTNTLHFTEPNLDPSQPKKDPQTVNPSGEKVKQLIAGLNIRPAVTHVDQRGELVEIFRTDWAYDEKANPQVYMVMTLPGKVRGWVVHRLQDDRMFFASGTHKVVLYDTREDSATFGVINELYFNETNRSLITYPAGVYHAVQNVGLTPAVFINCPTRLYDHKNPDKFRLPLENDIIPYKWIDP